MNIAIDCRYLGLSGIGRVCEGIINNLDYSKHNYFLIGSPEKLKKYTNAKIIADYTNPYSLKGILSFNKELNKICDVCFIPNFLIPLGVKIPVFTIIHDLAFLDLKMTTKGIIDRIIKKYFIKRCVKKSKKIVCVSNFTKDRCNYYFKKYSYKFETQHIGLSEPIINFKNENVKKENSIVFVGNVKPHKGLHTLIEAYKKLPEEDKPELKIIGEKDNFAVGMDITNLQVQGVTFTGKLNDEELFKTVSNAKFLISPSLYEGFGVPPLEALYLSTKPIISDIPVYKEVYKDLDVEYFKMQDADDLAHKILTTNCAVNTTKEQILSMYNYKKFTKNIIVLIQKNTD